MKIPKELLVSAAILGILNGAVAENQIKTLSKTGVNKAFNAAGIPSPFGRHPNIPPIKVKDRAVYVLELLPSSKSRCSNNFNVDGEKQFRLYVMNVPPADRLRMKFQRKGDKKPSLTNPTGEDSDRGPLLNHSKDELWQMDGGNNYLAARGFSPEEIKNKSPDATILLIEQGITMDDVLAAFAD